MHVGYAAICQNPMNERSDRDVYLNEIRLAEQAEPLGFESIWSVEHHFTDYTMVPDVLQFLTYMAGRTRQIKLGSMVVVLPWHDPVRVAEQVSMLDHLSNGRFVLGLGRGAGRVEFEGFRVPMGESRDRFVESAEALISALEHGTMDYSGNYVNQPKVEIRPKPFKSFRGRTYAAAVSPESSVIMAKLGIGILIIPQKPWPMVAQELAAYRKVYQEVNGEAAPAVTTAGWVFCDEDPGRAREMGIRWIGGYWNTAIRHYEIGGEHFKNTKGYEFYAAMSAARSASEEQMIEGMLDLQVCGTPKQCVEKILDIKGRVGSDSFVGVFSYAGMPYDLADKNMRLFAEKVMPELKKA